MLKEKYQNAFQFFASYFHQDFGDEFGEPEIAVEKFIQGNDSVTRAVVIREIRQIMTGASEEQLDQMVFELGCYYSPQRHRGLTMTLWLNQVIVRLEESLKE